MEERSNYWLRRNVSRRSTLKGGAIAGVGAASLALVGCGDDDDSAPAGQASPTAGAAGTAAPATKVAKPSGTRSRASRRNIIAGPRVVRSRA